jgi:hypothetical protein
MQLGQVVDKEADYVVGGSVYKQPCRPAHVEIAAICICPNHEAVLRCASYRLCSPPVGKSHRFYKHKLPLIDLYSAMQY